VTPAWLDRREYPFESHWLDVGARRLHYVDEGRGETVVMVHGTPAWSYRPEDQARNLARLIATLELNDLTLVVHDYGGPIGLAYALEHPENVRRLVLFNTWMWSTADDRHFAWFGRLLGGRLGRWLYARGFSVRVMLRHAIADKRRYTRDVERHYLAPLDGHATWVYAREVLASSAWYDSLWQRRARIAGIPALLVWGMKDPAFGAYLGRWRGVFERAEVVALDCDTRPPRSAPPRCCQSSPSFSRARRRRR
jgi:haloalkane dehalogenase